MPNEGELSTALADAMAHLDKAKCALVTLSMSDSASSMARPISSSIPTGESDGDGSAPQTTGPTEEFTRRLAEETLEAARLSKVSRHVAEEMAQHMMRASYYLASAVCVSGGSESPAPRSGQRPDGSPGESSGPTPTDVPSALTPMTTPKELSARLHTAAALLSGIHERYASRFGRKDDYSVQMTLTHIRQIAAHLRTLT